LSESTPESAPELRFSDLALFVGLAAPCFVLAFGIAAFLLHFTGIEAEGLRVLLPQFAAYGAALLPLWAILRFRYDRSPVELLRLSISPRDVAPSFALGIIAAVSVFAAAALLKPPPIETPLEKLLEDNPSLIAMAIFGVTLGPWFEELFFRGLLQPVMTRAAGVVVGIGISALPFALLHGPQYGWSWRHIVLVAAAGVAFGWQRYRTDSTGAAAVMHAAYNFVLFAAFIAGKFFGADVPRAI
jgi:membrane protease YdiL (CAAX protease family)